MSGLRAAEGRVQADHKRAPGTLGGSGNVLYLDRG